MRGQAGMSWGRAIAGTVLVALGVSLLLSSVRKCTDCEESPEQSAADIAAASAEMSEP